MLTVHVSDRAFVGLRVFLAHWLLKGISAEVTTLRREVERLQAETSALRRWALWGNQGECR